MANFDRMQQLHQLLKARRRPVPLATLAERMECSERTVSRYLDDLRSKLNAPIEYDRTANGWCYVESDNFELPGLWMTSEEMQSLTLLLHVLENFGNGLLNQELVTVKRQVQQLLSARGIDLGTFTDRIRVLPLANRYVAGDVFQQVGEALLQRRQVVLRYRSFDNKATTRRLCPQTLVYYRENWYLDAYCHLREALRTFSLARIEGIESVDGTARSIPRDELNQHFADSYGIFAGSARHTARLRFAPEIAREIAQQQWHPAQSGEWDGDEYVLSIPYSDDRELIGDILRHMPHVSVEAPAALRSTVVRRLQAGLRVNK